MTPSQQPCAGRIDAWVLCFLADSAFKHSSTYAGQPRAFLQYAHTEACAHLAYCAYQYTPWHGQDATQVVPVYGISLEPIEIHHWRFDHFQVRVHPGVPIAPS